MATGFDKFLSKPLPTTVKPTEHGLRTIIRRWEISAEALRAANADTNAFPAYETPDVEYTSALLVEQSTGDGSAFGVKLMYWRVYQELPENVADLVQLGKTVFSTTENGLQTAEQRFVARAGHVLTGNVGTDTGGAGTDVEGLYLAGRGFGERGRVSAIVVRRWAEAGILDASREFGEDGLLYVTFVSQGTKFTPTALKAGKELTDPEIEAFQGGAEADLRYSRTRNVNGFRRFTVTVMLKSDGDPLGEGDNLIQDYQNWVDHQKPGYFHLGMGTITAQAGTPKSVRANIQVYLSKNGTIDDSFKPYSINHWASYTYSYTPTATGISVTKVGSANGYLSTGNNFAANGGEVFGVEVDSAAGTSTSSPLFADLFNLEDQVIQSRNRPAFTTDEGVAWYRKVKVTVDGYFGTYMIPGFTPPAP